MYRCRQEVSAFGDKVNAGPFSATHGALNAAATWNLPIIKPFIGVEADIPLVTKRASDANRS